MPDTADDLRQARAAVLLSASLDAERDAEGNLTPESVRALKALAERLADPDLHAQVVREAQHATSVEQTNF